MKSGAYPVQIEGELDPSVSRWLWLVKWLLAIPHYIVLAFLWLTLFVLTIVAFFAILVTGRYPRGIFDFNLGVLRWSWRVGFYSYAALGTDRYPPFTLHDVPDYPARLDIAYPAQLSRGLVLVKWWLLAIPHYIVVGILLGGGSYAASRAYDRAWGFGYQTGLIGILVFFAGVSLLFTTRYPRGIFDLVVGFDRWVARVAGYVLLMRDEYPPFRLDQGGAEKTLTEEHAAVTVAAPVDDETAQPSGGTAGRVVLIVVGVIAGIVAFALLVGGCALVAVDQTQRDSDGFLMSPSEKFATPTYAIVSESANLDLNDAEWFVDRFLGNVRIRSENDSERPIFLGIAPERDALAYLGGSDYDVVTNIDRDPRYSLHAGSGAPASPPAHEKFWAASVEGVGEQTLDWEPTDGNWRVIVMNADASRGVVTRLSIGAELDSVLWIGFGMLGVGLLFAAGAALAITAGARRRR